jgi:hypothetical protein
MLVECGGANPCNLNPATGYSTSHFVFSVSNTTSPFSVYAYEGGDFTAYYGPNPFQYWTTCCNNGQPCSSGGATKHWVTYPDCTTAIAFISVYVSNATAISIDTFGKVGPM